MHAMRFILSGCVCKRKQNSLRQLGRKHRMIAIVQFRYDREVADQRLVRRRLARSTKIFNARISRRSKGQSLPLILLAGTRLNYPPRCSARRNLGGKGYFGRGQKGDTPRLEIKYRKCRTFKSRFVRYSFGIQKD